MNSDANERSNQMNKDPRGVIVPDVLPILPADGVVIYPFVAARIVVPSRHQTLLQDAVKANRFVGLVAKADYGRESDQGLKAIEIGTMIRVKELTTMPDGNALVSIKGVKRIRLLETVSSDPYVTARIEPAEEFIVDEIEAEALRRRLIGLALEVIELSPQIPDEVGEIIRRMSSPLKLSYQLAGNIQMELQQRMALLRHDAIEDKMKDLIELLQKELEVLRVSKSIDDQVNDEMTSKQREFHLRQKLEAIQKELGEDDTPPSEVDDYRKKIESSAMSAEARQEATRELNRLEKISPHSAEYAIIETYLDWLLDLPWDAPNFKAIDIANAREALDNGHFGLEPVKDRIIEYLAVYQLQKKRRGEIESLSGNMAEKGVILCLAGPPGTGKTSLGKSIADAMGRRFTRMSLGGIRDESEIRGHRRTYVGALPGRIIQAIKRAGTRNPVFMLDEIDKIGHDWRGDPSSALLEVLDPEQNAAFRDHYLDVDFDLSEVMFIATANQLDTIPPALQDRMEIITLEGYTDHEKFQIAKNHLIPRQMGAFGLLENEVTFMDEAIHKIIRDYTREAGVRSLERQIGAICRKSVVTLHENKWHSIAITSDQVKTFLKKELFRHEQAEETGMPGIVTGLAVTAAGGEILYIEASRMPGKGQLILTGHLGDVMKESARIAHSYVRSRAGMLGIGPDDFDQTDVHLHIPAGALPKDGPSAGVAMTLALASAFSGRPVPGNLGTTGEVTLRGRVLPVGGIKMKLLAGHRAGLTQIIVPERNRRDIDELPEEIAKSVEIKLLDTMDDVLAAVFPHASLPADPALPPGDCHAAGCDGELVSARPPATSRAATHFFNTVSGGIHHGKTA